VRIAQADIWTGANRRLLRYIIIIIRSGLNPSWLMYSNQLKRSMMTRHARDKRQILTVASNPGRRIRVRPCRDEFAITASTICGDELCCSVERLATMESQFCWITPSITLSRVCLPTYPPTPRAGSALHVARMRCIHKREQAQYLSNTRLACN